MNGRECGLQSICTTYWLVLWVKGFFRSVTHGIILFFCFVFCCCFWLFCKKLKHQQIFTDFSGTANQLCTSSSAFLTHTGQRHLHTWSGTRAHGHGRLTGGRGLGSRKHLPCLELTSDGICDGCDPGEKCSSLYVMRGVRGWTA